MNVYAKYECPSSKNKDFMANVIFIEWKFQEVGVASKVKVTGVYMWYQVKGLVKRNLHVKYESCQMSIVVVTCNWIFQNVTFKVGVAPKVKVTEV